MHRTGKIFSILIIAIIIVLVIGIGIFQWYRNGINEAVSLDEATQQAWANVDAQLQRRLELIPNLVETVKGYASHEKELFENIAQSRERYFQGNTPLEKIQTSNQLSGMLSRLLVLQERYPELKANQNFLSLQDQLEGTENRISVARTRYNESAKTLNQYVRSFFGSYFCNKRGIERAAYFEATEQAQKAPQVTF